jgi:hypothetical protein
MKHTCHAEGCRTAVPPKYLMCGKHWAMVPQTQRTEIWRHYRDGQEIDKRPSTEYLRVMKIAIDLVARAEGQQGSLL